MQRDRADQLGEVAAVFFRLSLRLQSPQEAGRCQCRGDQHDDEQAGHDRDRMALESPPGGANECIGPGIHLLVPQEAAEIGGEGLHVVVPITGPGISRLVDDGLQCTIGRCSRHVVLHRILDCVASLADRFPGVDGSVGPPKRHELEEDEAERVLVAGRPEGVDVAAGLLGRHVGRGPQDRTTHCGRRLRGDALFTRLRILGADEVSDPPIRDEDLVEVADHDVVGLEVAVDDAVVVGVGHGVADVQEQLESRLEGMVRVWLLAAVVEATCVIDEVCKVAPGDQLHRVGELAAPIEAVHRDDSRVVELSGDLRFGEELGCSLFAQMSLQGDGPPQRGVPGDDDLSHRAPPDHPELFVARPSQPAAQGEGGTTGDQDLARRRPLDVALVEQEGDEGVWVGIAHGLGEVGPEGNEVAVEVRR